MRQFDLRFTHSLIPPAGTLTGFETLLESTRINKAHKRPL